MEAVQLCNQCGAALAEDVPEGLCPKCLVTAGLMSELSMAAKATVVVTASQLLSESRPQPSIAAPEPSQQFGGYRIIRPLGKGGMGAVYEAEEIENGRRVALKVLSHSLDSLEARKRFLREGRLAASVNHPNSVYIYGTEEINGTPVITMELVSGGTLQARVNNEGPLPIREAVDATLQIIAGLEAAATIGVLHRDVKPSNCFIETDGTVKVGDFGLSISTLAQAETNLTATGAFLGTPAYASPEQLRGDELDVRSDIYAVGVTLYYLLTGKTPFMADNMVKLLATILEQPAESPEKLRPEIPKELANVVLRCLAKKKEQRFKTYEELRQGLLPFDSTTPVPAPRALRFCAFAVDGIIFLVLRIFTFMLVEPFVGSPERIARIDGWILKGFLAGAIFYFAISEGVWGASLGKAICGLRVVGRNRLGPGFPRAALRTLILFPVIYACWNAREWLLPGYLLQASLGQPGFLIRVVAGLIGKFLPFALFFTARRENGFAGLHDLASNTRVVRKRNSQARPVMLDTDSAEPETATFQKLGPYDVLAILGKTEEHELLLGYDRRLLRKVWIRKLPLGTPPLHPRRHALSRPARLRWLNGRRAPDDCWDAFEAATGKSLVQSLKPPQSWRTARHWLYDLAEELAAAIKDRSLPPVLALDRIWITNEGRAKLLDFPAPGIQANDETERASQTGLAPTQSEDRQVQMFLKQAAASAVQGRIVSTEEVGERPVAAVLPLHARAFLNALPNLSGLEPMLTRLGSLLNQVALISFARRAVLIAGCSLPVTVAMLLVLVTAFFTLSKIYPRMGPLYSCLERIETLERSAQAEESKFERWAFEIYVAGNFRDTLTNQMFWPKRGTGQAADKTRLKEFRARMERILGEHPTPSPTEIANATVVVKPFLDRIPPADLTHRFFVHIWVAVVYGLGLIVAAPSIIAALLFRGGLLVHSLGIEFVTWDGLPASRGRLFARSLVTWSPLLVFAILFRPVTPFMASAQTAAVITLGLLAIGAAWSLASRRGGLQDRITEVWLVPR